MPDTPDSLPPLDELEKKISAAQETGHDKQHNKNNNGFGMALRIGAEFASGVLVGGVFGWLLDQWLETFPLFFIICFMLGSVAGALTVYRTISSMDSQQ